MNENCETLSIPRKPKRNFIFFFKRGVGILCVSTIIGLYVVMFIAGWKVGDAVVRISTVMGGFIIVVYGIIWGFSKSGDR